MSKKPQKPKYGRRAFIATAVVGAIGGLYVGLSGTHNPHDIKNPKERQKYLDDLVSGHELPYVSEVTYDHDGSEMLAFLKKQLYADSELTDRARKIALRQYNTMFRNGAYDLKTPESLHCSEQDHTSPILAGRHIFEHPNFAQMTREDAKQAIIVHETRHALQHAKGLGLIPKHQLIAGIKSGTFSMRALYAAGELDANAEEIRQTQKGDVDVSNWYLQKVVQSYKDNYAFLQRAFPRSPPVQRRFITAAFGKVKDLGKNPVIK